MSWFEFKEQEPEKYDFRLEPEQGLIFTNIKMEDEFEILIINLEEEKDGSTDPVKCIPS